MKRIASAGPGREGTLSVWSCAGCKRCSRRWRRGFGPHSCAPRRGAQAGPDAGLPSSIAQLETVV